MILLVDQVIMGWTYGSHIIELLSPGAVRTKNPICSCSGKQQKLWLLLQCRAEENLVESMMREGPMWKAREKRWGGRGWAPGELLTLLALLPRAWTMLRFSVCFSWLLDESVVSSGKTQGWNSFISCRQIVHVQWRFLNSYDLRIFSLPSYAATITRRKTQTQRSFSENSKLRICCQASLESHSVHCTGEQCSQRNWIFLWKKKAKPNKTYVIFLWMSYFSVSMIEHHHEGWQKGLFGLMVPGRWVCLGEEVWQQTCDSSWVLRPYTTAQSRGTSCLIVSRKSRVCGFKIGNISLFQGFNFHIAN